MAPRLDEFALIARWRSHFEPSGADVPIPNGDDAAAMRVPEGSVLVATTDAFVEGVHFDRRLPAGAIGHKALAVNLSDLAAMGARPRWALLALALPKDTAPRWLDAVAEGMSALARAHGVHLVGGNVTASAAISFTMTLLGEAPEARLLRRGGARPGDRVFVSGTLGDSALGLERLGARRSGTGRLGVLEARHGRPTPRVALGLAVASRQAASACIDVSDGLAADLGHVLTASGVGAEIDLAKLPLSAAYRRAVRDRPDPFGPALTGGEDYELVLTVPPGRRRGFLAAARAAETPVSEIGVVTAGPGLVLRAPDGRPYPLQRAGWTHL